MAAEYILDTTHLWVDERSLTLFKDPFPSHENADTHLYTRNGLYLIGHGSGNIHVHFRSDKLPPKRAAYSVEFDIQAAPDVDAENNLSLPVLNKSRGSLSRLGLLSFERRSIMNLARLYGTPYIRAAVRSHRVDQEATRTLRNAQIRQSVGRVVVEALRNREDNPEYLENILQSYPEEQISNLLAFP